MEAAIDPLPGVILFHSGLDLTQYMQAPDQPEPVYDLFAVSNHFGGMGGGHCKQSSHH